MFFFGAGRLKVLKLEQIYQKRTGCNRLSLCIAWPAVKSETCGGATAGASGLCCCSLVEPMRTGSPCVYKGVGQWLWLSITAQRVGGQARLGTEYPLNLSEWHTRWWYRRVVVTVRFGCSFLNGHVMFCFKLGDFLFLLFEGVDRSSTQA